MTAAKNESKHIAVLSFPFGTHAAPLLSLVRRLSAALPDALFSFFGTAASNRTIFSEDDALGNVKPYSVLDGLPEKYVFSGNHQEPVELFLKATPGNFREAMEVAVGERGRPITCILADAFLWFAADMALELHVSWVPLWTAGPRSLLLHVETDLIRQNMGLSGTESKSLTILPGMSGIRDIDIPEGIITGDLKSPFATMLRKMGLMLPRAAAVATNSFEDLDPITVNALKSRFNKFLNVGPFALAFVDKPSPDSQGCLEWLDKQQRGSVVYVSFGSMLTPPPHELAALAEALEESRFPFLWSFRGNPKEKLPEGFLERTKDQGKVVSWVPQLRVLQHSSTGVFLTHCGWNSVLESILGCLPMICRPFLGDQHLNTRTVDAVWGTGVAIEGGKITKDAAMDALKLILLTEEGKKMRMKLKVFQDIALDAVQPHGSSTQNYETLVEIIRK